MVCIAIVCILIALVGGAVDGCSVSDGTRSGVVTKFTSKGLFTKSWEGEMVAGGLRAGANGMVANVWHFSVQDAKLVPIVQAACESGQTVALKYHQTAGYNPASRDSAYLIVGVVTNKAER